MSLPADLERRLQSCSTLPSIPTVVIEVLDLCEREDIGLHEVAGVLAKDPALAVKLLRVANSALYGARYQIKTLDRAISIMGTNAALSLALSFSFVENMSKSKKAGFDYSAYWHRSAITAIAARALFEWTNEMSRDELFLAGLLQDIGMLVLNEGIPDVYGKIVASSNCQHSRLVELENEALGTDHSTVGAWMLNRWKLPEDLIFSVGASHNLSASADIHESDASKVLALAGQLAEIWCDPDIATATGKARQSATDLLGISDKKFDVLLSSIVVSMSEITHNLEIDLGGEEHSSRILNQAREALVILNLQAQHQVNEMRNIAEVDGLTSLFNRSYLEKILAELFDNSCKTGLPLSVLFIDIDYFKRVNDNYGHQVGDRILSSVASVIKLTIRDTDIATRYGGEEFVCLLPNTPEEGVLLVAERLRNAIASKPHTTGNDLEISVTASLGCATYSSKSKFENPAEFLKEADRCLYLAKRQGRNRVVTSNPLTANERVS